MPITTDAQFEIRSTVFGRGTNDLWFNKERVSGLLGNPEPKSADVDLWGQDGAYGSPEYDGPRLITIDALITSSTQAGVATALAALRTAWARSHTNIALKVRLMGTTYQVSGRPRGFREDLSRLDICVAEVLLRFDALDPTLTTV